VGRSQLICSVRNDQFTEKFLNIVFRFVKSVLNPRFTPPLKLMMIESMTMPSSIATKLTALLEPIAAWFRGLGIPEPITHWGHPVMMGIVVLVMGSYVGYAGWQGKLAQDKDVALKNRADHRKLAPFMSLFIALGYTGGVLSLLIQKQPILESPHFWTGSVVLLLLGLNGTLSLSGFLGDKPAVRIAHAYIGTFALLLLIVHGALGLKLGLAI